MALARIPALGSPRLRRTCSIMACETRRQLCGGIAQRTCQASVSPYRVIPDSQIGSLQGQRHCLEHLGRADLAQGKAQTPGSPGLPGSVLRNQWSDCISPIRPSAWLPPSVLSDHRRQPLHQGGNHPIAETDYQSMARPIPASARADRVGQCRKRKRPVQRAAWPPPILSGLFRPHQFQAAPEIFQTSAFQKSLDGFI